MKCARCGAIFAKKVAALHALTLCPKRRRTPTYKRGREGVMTDEEERFLAGPPKPWTQLDLFEEFVDRGRHAQAAVDAIIKKHGSGRS
jgi:hypothetical protein